MKNVICLQKWIDMEDKYFPKWKKINGFCDRMEKGRRLKYKNFISE